MIPVIGYVFVMIALGRLLAEVAERMGYPGFLGEILAGILLGFVVVNPPKEELGMLAEMGLFFLMISAGLELTPEETRLGGRAAFPVYVVVFIIMTLLTYPITRSIGLSNLLAGSILAVSSAPIVLKLRRFFGEDFLHVALSYAVISEVAVLALVYTFASIKSGGTDVWLKIAEQVLFIGGLFYANHVLGIEHRLWLISKLRGLKSDEAVFGMFMVVATSLGLFSEIVGMHFTVGGFLAGLFLHSDLVGTKQYKRLTTIISGMTFGIFAPIFFVWRGINFRAGITPYVLFLFLALYGVRFILTATLMGGEDIIVSLARGAGVSSFGVLGLMVAEIGKGYGLLENGLYSLVVFSSVAGIFLSATIGLVLLKLKKAPPELF